MGITSSTVKLENRKCQHINCKKQFYQAVTEGIQPAFVPSDPRRMKTAERDTNLTILTVVWENSSQAYSSCFSRDFNEPR